MKLPSLNRIHQKATTTLRRFPFTLLCSIVVAGIIIYLTQVSLDDQTIPKILGKIALCGFLGIPFFTAITLFLESKNMNSVPWWIGHGIGLALLIAYYFALPASLDGPHYVALYRYALFVIGLHLLVAIAPFRGENGTGAFWQYNKHLFLRFLTALLFTGVLYAGLSIALVAIHVLFSVHIDPKWYIQLFTFVGVIFNTWFFLAGIPTSLQAFEKRTSYPKGLKIFTQNVLLPLVVVYLTILYLYMIKIIVQWTWPEGWVAILVLSFSIVGIFAILLLYPVRHKSENKWINRFYTGYFAALVPLVILLLLAIYRRVSDYGVTINRYFVIVLAFWLAGVVIYFLISKAQNIKVIPGSLCLIAFVISFGPWGAFSVSRRSQVHRLETYLKKNEILQNGKIHKASSEVPKNDRDEIKSILKYLNNTNSLEVIQPWFKKDLTKRIIKTSGEDSLRTISHYQRMSYALELMGIGYGSASRIAATGGSRKFQRYYLYADQKNVFPIRHFDWFIRGLRWSNNGVLNKTYAVNNREVVFESHKNDAKIYIYYKNAKNKGLTVDMNDIIQKLQSRLSSDQHKLPVKELAFSVSNGNFRAKLYINRINWRASEDSTKQKSATFSIAFK